jgi:hypothetical protein
MAQWSWTRAAIPHRNSLDGASSEGQMGSNNIAAMPMVDAVQNST